MALFTYRGGVKLVETGLMFDSLRGQELCFLSSVAALFGAELASGKSPAQRRPGRSRAVLLCTEKTLALARALGCEQALPAAQLVSPCGRPFQFGSLRLELFPSGAQPGAASLLVRLRSGERIVYAGAPRLPAAAGCDPTQLRAAEVLVIAAPLATVADALPSREAALEAAAALCDPANADAPSGSTIFLVSPFGAEVELYSHLVALGRAPLLHPRLAQLVKAYAAVGALAESPPPKRLPARGAPLPTGSVVLWPLAEPLPPALLQSLAPRPLRICIHSAQALRPEIADELRTRNTDEASRQSGLSWHAIAYPDALDRRGLLHYVAETGARLVHLLSGFSEQLAAELAARGIRTEALGPPRQLALFSQLSAP